MTGEITLTGQVLPIGGLKEKVLAAQRAGLTRVIVPRRNEADVEEIPEPLREGLEFVFVDEIDEVLDAALRRRRVRTAGVCSPTERTPTRESAMAAKKKAAKAGAGGRGRRSRTTRTCSG